MLKNWIRRWRLRLAERLLPRELAAFTAQGVYQAQDRLERIMLLQRKSGSQGRGRHARRKMQRWLFEARMALADAICL